MRYREYDNLYPFNSIHDRELKAFDEYPPRPQFPWKYELQRR